MTDFTINYPLNVLQNEINNIQNITGDFLLKAGDTATGVINFDAGLTSSDQILNEDGTDALPAYSFSSDPNSGIYSVADNEVGISANGDQVLSLSSSQIVASKGINPLSTAATLNLGSSTRHWNNLLLDTTGSVSFYDGTSAVAVISENNGRITNANGGFLAEDGSAGAPAFSFNDSTNSGLYYLSDGGLLRPNGPVISQGGSTCMNFSSDGSASMVLRNNDDYSSLGQLNNSADTAVFQSVGDLELMCDANGFGDHSIKFTHSSGAVSDPLRGGGDVLAEINEDGQILASDGTETLPSISFIDDADTGMYTPSDNQLAFTCGDDTKLTLQADKLTTKALYELGDATNTLGDIHIENGFRLKWASGGTESCQILNFGNDFRTLDSAILSGTVASAGAPAFSFVDDTDTGMYRSAANQLGFAVAGEKQLEITPTQLTPRIAAGPTRMNIGDTTNTFGIVTIENAFEYQWASGGTISARLRNFGSSVWSAGTDGGFVCSDGTEANPAYSFAADGGVGMYRIDDDNLGFSCSGDKQLDLTTSAATFTNQITAPAFNLSSNEGDWTLAGTTSGVNLTGTAAFTGSYYQRIGSVVKASAKLTGLSITTGTAGTTTSFQGIEFPDGTPTVLYGTTYCRTSAGDLFLMDNQITGGTLLIEAPNPLVMNTGACTISINIWYDL